MAIIEQTETSVEKVETTETVRHIQCDVCDDSWAEDSDMTIHEFSVDRAKIEEFNSLSELSDAIEAYHTKQPVEEVKKADGVIDVPKTNLVDALEKEVELAGTPASPHIHNIRPTVGGHTESERDELEDLIGDNSFYLSDGFIHHFMYRLKVEWTAEETRHVCDDCYDIVF